MRFYDRENQLKHLTNGKSASENYAEIVRERQEAIKQMRQEQEDQQQVKKDEK